MGDAHGSGSVSGAHLWVFSAKCDAGILVCECIWYAAGGFLWLSVLFRQVSETFRQWFLLYAWVVQCDNPVLEQRRHP